MTYVLTFTCTSCTAEFGLEYSDDQFGEVPNYCPNCGASMEDTDDGYDDEYEYDVEDDPREWEEN